MVGGEGFEVLLGNPCRANSRDYILVLVTACFVYPPTPKNFISNWTKARQQASPDSNLDTFRTRSKRVPR
ncbi:hypothetical protein TMatcc_009793 [Talaromyces marneffei ATCC 18224]